MKQILIALSCILIGQTISAEEFKDFGRDRLNSSPRHSEWIDFKSGDHMIKAFVVYPERKDKAPTVLVIQEIFGLTDWLRIRSKRFSTRPPITRSKFRRATARLLSVDFVGAGDGGSCTRM